MIATGNHLPGHSALNDKTIVSNPKYFPNPWTENAVLGLDGSAPVFIIGTGLTMVDVVIGLQEKNSVIKFTRFHRRDLISLLIVRIILSVKSWMNSPHPMNLKNSYNCFANMYAKPGNTEKAEKLLWMLFVQKRRRSGNH